MKLLIVAAFLVSTTTAVRGQAVHKLIKQEEVTRIETALASDDMQGRKSFTPSADKAAAFIADEFAAIGLVPLPGQKNYLQHFSVVRPKLISLSAIFDGQAFDTAKVVAITSLEELIVNETSGFTTAYINKDDNLFLKAMEYNESGKNMVIYVDESFTAQFSRLAFLKRLMLKTGATLLFVLKNSPPEKYTIAAKHDITTLKGVNIVGVLPGKSKSNEYIIFSGHYDHLGIGKPVGKDSIYNGANDDASGITAVISIADYFKQVKKNERSLVFVAFAAEEVGGFGSKYFARQVQPDKVVAMFNIEMIGTESKWGKNTAYITGYEKSDMGKILQKNLQGSSFAFHPDPYPEEQLFYRSDNATLARLGVPAHTISTSKMDVEPNYHKVSDEVNTLDLQNMTAIIQAIVTSAQSIISGYDTPNRVNINGL